MLIPLYNLKFVIHSFTEIGKVIRFDKKMIILEYFIGIAQYRRGFKTLFKKDYRRQKSVLFLCY